MYSCVVIPTSYGHEINLYCPALHIKAEVMRWVYSSGSEKKPKPRPVPLKLSKPAGAGSFFSSLFTSLSGNATPQRSITPLPVVEKVVDPLTINETSVSLSIFSADVDVRLNKKVAAELHRSTKKNPPNKLKYDLIYVSNLGTFDYQQSPNFGKPRLLKTNMMPARKKTRSNLTLQGVFSRACARTLMGMFVKEVHRIYSLFPYSAGLARVFIVSISCSFLL